MNAARCLRFLLLLANSAFILVHAYAIHSSCAIYGNSVKEAMEEAHYMADLAFRNLGPPPIFDTEDNSSEQLWHGFQPGDFADLKGTLTQASHY
jgi:purine nucleoside permease